MRLRALLDTPFAMLLPLLVWGAHLLFVYGVLSVGCAVRPGSAAAVVAVLWVATVAAGVALLFLGAAQWRRCRAGQEGSETRALALAAGPSLDAIALVAVLWTALPLLFIDPCA